MSHEDLTLEAADGTPFAAFEAVPDEPSGSGVSSCRTCAGCTRSTRSSRCASPSAGSARVAIDYFGRTAGVAKRGDDFSYMEHVAQTTPEGLRADTAAAVEHLRSRGCERVFTVGFCFGGRNAWLAAADGLGLAGAVGFYGRPGPREGVPGPMQRAQELEAPILALMGGADEGIPPEDVAAFEAALAAAGVEHEVITYEGAPHSFFDRKQAEHAEASDDAWRRVLGFLERHGG